METVVFFQIGLLLSIAIAVVLLLIVYHQSQNPEEADPERRILLSGERRTSFSWKQ